MQIPENPASTGDIAEALDDCCRNLTGDAAEPREAPDFHGYGHSLPIAVSGIVVAIEQRKMPRPDKARHGFCDWKRPFSWRLAPGSCWIPPVPETAGRQFHRLARSICASSHRRAASP
jgi:hypothetical protein